MPADSQEEPQASLTQTQPIASQLKRPLPSLPLVHARLVPIIKADETAPFEIREGCDEVVVGRHPQHCQFVLEDRRVSARHLRIYRTGRRQYYVEQLGSNGCFINEQHLRKGDTRALHHGDEISLCMHAHESREQPIAAFIFRISGHEASKANRTVDTIREAVAATPRPQPAVAQVGSHSVSDQWVRENWDMRVSLGKGYFSEVWEGTQVSTGVRRAIKAVDKSRFCSFQARNGSALSLSDEAEVLMGLSHPGIVTVYEWFETPTHLFLVMEVLEGGDLLDFVIRRGSLPEPEARRLFRELCGAIAFLHSEDVVHRDIKPENILLTDTVNETHVKLADFGLAKNNVHSRDCQTFCGTPNYFAPEIIGTFRERMGGQPAGYGKPVDLWGLGVVLYIMLSGVPPFEEDEGSLYEQILQGRFEFDVPAWNVVTPEAKCMVKQLMTVDPNERLTIEQALTHPWLQQPDVEATGDASQKRRRKADGVPDAFGALVPKSSMHGGCKMSGHEFSGSSGGACS